MTRIFILILRDGPLRCVRSGESFCCNVLYDVQIVDTMTHRSRILLRPELGERPKGAQTASSEKH